MWIYHGWLYWHLYLKIDIKDWHLHPNLVFQYSKLDWHLHIHLFFQDPHLHLHFSPRIDTSTHTLICDFLFGIDTWIFNLFFMIHTWIFSLLPRTDNRIFIYIFCVCTWIFILIIRRFLFRICFIVESFYFNNSSM